MRDAHGVPAFQSANGSRTSRRLAAFTRVDRIGTLIDRIGTSSGDTRVYLTWTLSEEAGEEVMILYASPLACSGAAHMVLLELGIPHEIEFVDIYAQPHVLIDDGMPFADVNPKNAVPALRLDSGELLTEVGVILQYIADLKPDSSLPPKAGSLARYRVMEWLNYVGSDVHKTIGPLFHPHMRA